MESVSRPYKTPWKKIRTWTAHRRKLLHLHSACWKSHSVRFHQTLKIERLRDGLPWTFFSPVLKSMISKTRFILKTCLLRNPENAQLNSKRSILVHFASHGRYILQRWNKCGFKILISEGEKKSQTDFHFLLLTFLAVHILSRRSISLFSSSLLMIL